MDAPIQSSAALVTDEATQSAKKTENTQQRKITPAQEPAGAAAAPPNKAKQQTLMASFFGKSKFPATPSVTATDEPAKKELAPAQKKKIRKQEVEESTKKPAEKISQTSVTPAVVAAGKVKISTSSKRHTKMDFKGVVVGKLSGRKCSFSSSQPKKLGTAMDKRRTDDLDALLPRIPPLSAVQVMKQPAVTKPTETNQVADNTKTAEISDVQSVEDSEAVEIGAVRSQLVHKFENPPMSDEKSKQLDSDKVNVKAAKTEEKDQKTASRSGSDNKVIEIEIDTERTDNNAESKETTGMDASAEDPSSKDQRMVDKTDNHVENEAEDSKSKEANAGTHATTQSESETPRETNKSGDSKSNSPPPAGATESSHLNSDSAKLLRKHESMRVKHCEQASKLVMKARNGLEEELFESSMPSTDGISLSSAPEFPDGAVPHLVCLLEGR